MPSDAPKNPRVPPRPIAPWPEPPTCSTGEPLVTEITEPQPDPVPVPATATAKPAPSDPNESGGPKGPEPTRYGDWEKKGRCVDF
ncbi:conserved protein of unknown function (DUF1674) [Magnetospira sp. QH-2]|nr:DUF1674 domain-containing protein [Magnetospira sp. QH-2]CCQ72173.1 conserved protein of unknown function (DUF1674) [Magnetospira sp. QH-2]